MIDYLFLPAITVDVLVLYSSHSDTPCKINCAGFPLEYSTMTSKWLY